MQKTTIKVISQFSFLLLGLLIGSITIQFFIYNFRDYSLLGGNVIPSYIFNFLYALATFTLLLNAHRKKSNQIGFIYMGLSLTKLIIFMAVFRTIFHRDGVMDNFETLGFLIPYLICLFTETLYLVRLLKVNPTEN